MMTTKRPEIYAIAYGDISPSIIGIWLKRYEEGEKEETQLLINPYPHITTTFNKMTVTHIVIDPIVAEKKMMKKIHALTGMTLQELDDDNIKIVSSSWIFKWLKNKKIVEVAPYLINNDNSFKITVQVKKKQKRSENDNNESQNDLLLPGVNSERPKISNNRQEIKDEYSKTKEYYKQPEQRSILIGPSIKYKFDLQFSLESSKKYRTTVKIWKCDTLHCALDLKYKELLNPLVLNMANAKKPGGGVNWGALAQEETLFYRSNYHLHLLESLYPIPDLEAIYSEGVHIRASANTPRDLDFIASAAINKPKLIESGRYQEEDRQLMLNKIELIFQVGLQTKHDSLLLGAFGCGAFRNPCHLVAALFLKMIKKYNGCFKRIDFAIIPPLDKDSPDNFEVFKTIFEKSSLYNDDIMLMIKQ